MSQPLIVVLPHSLKEAMRRLQPGLAKAADRRAIMDFLHRVGDFWVRRRAMPDVNALEKIANLKQATVITGASEDWDLPWRAASPGSAVHACRSSVKIHRSELG